MSDSEKFGAPYRPPCGGWPERQLWFLGGFYQHWRPTDIAQKWTNVTRVPNWVCPISPGVAPFAREVSNLPDSCYDDPTNANCTGTVYPPDCGGAGDTGLPPCCDDPECFAPFFMGACAEDHQVMIDGNCYQRNGDLDQSRCIKLGFKNAQARKVWHGVFGYLSPMRGDFPYTDGAFSCGSGVDGPLQMSPDDTKYLSQAVHVEFHSSGDGIDSIDATLDGSCSVGRNSGNVTRACSSTGTPGNSIGGVSNADGGLFGDLQNASLAWLAAIYGTMRNGSGPTPGLISSMPCAPTSTTGSTSAPPLSTVWTDCFDGAHTTENVLLTVDPSGSFNYHQENVSDTGDTITFDTTIELTNSTVTFSQTVDSLVDGIAFHAELTGSAELSDPYTSADFLGDALDMLAHWDFADDVTYPWRRDNFCTVAPLVSRHEVPGPVAPLVVNDYSADDPCPAVDSVYTGDLRGAPFNVGVGIKAVPDLGHFDWRHPTWRRCHDDADGTTVYFPFGYGGYSSQTNLNDRTDAVVPAAATQWTDNYTAAAKLVPWAFMIHEAGVLTVQKWAEVSVPRPSYSFARPCGEDRYALHEDHVWCIGTTDPGAKQVGLSEDASASITPGDKYLICGTADMDGVWPVVSVSGATVQLDDKVADVPTSALEGCYTGIFGKLRFPDGPGICGRVGVEEYSIAGGVVTVTLKEAADWLRTGDKVDFTEPSGAVTESNKTVTVVSATQFTYSGAAPTGVFVKSHGAADYWWDDDNPKREYVYAEWKFDNRDYQEVDRLNAAHVSFPDCTPAGGDAIRQYQGGHGMPQNVKEFTVTQECLMLRPCCPTVMVIAPDSDVDSFEHADRYNFPNDFVCDDHYGSRWQGQIVQHMADPLWQRPHLPCVDCGGVQPLICAWAEDDGFCRNDTCADDCIAVDGQKRYFAQRPWVENRLTLPTDGGPGLDQTAPALPGGVYIGYLGLDDLDTAGDVAGNVLGPPGTPGDDGAASFVPNDTFTPWFVYLAEQACVCDEAPAESNRFLSQYEKNGVLC